MTRLEEVALKTLLRHKFANGFVFVQGHHDRIVLKQAIRLGLVNPEGYVTRAGEQFLTGPENSHAGLDSALDEPPS